MLGLCVVPRALLNDWKRKFRSVSSVCQGFMQLYIAFLIWIHKRSLNSFHLLLISNGLSIPTEYAVVISSMNLIMLGSDDVPTSR